MCRWAAYLGEAVFLEDILTAPCHSLIAQSHCAQEAKSPTNGDGFGLAWYGDRPEPGLVVRRGDARPSHADGSDDEGPGADRHCVVDAEHRAEACQEESVPDPEARANMLSVPTMRPRCSIGAAS